MRMDERQSEEVRNAKYQQENINNGIGRARTNWQKVRNIFKQIRKGKNVSKQFQKQQRISCLNNQNAHKSKIIMKQEILLKGQQKYEFMKHNFNIMTDLLKNGEIIKTTNFINFYSSNCLIQAFNTKNNVPGQKTLEFAQFSQKKQLSNIKLVTYRPIPKLDYLINQKIGVGNIDTTGTWVWEAEQILAYFYTKKYREYLTNCQEVKILQLGAGCSGLGAMTLTKILNKLIKQQKFSAQKASQNIEKNSNFFIKSIQTIITDGKNENIEFLKRNIEQNFKNQQYQNTIKISACKYLWGSKQLSNQNKSQKFTIICGSDILFFETYHIQLITTLYQFLSEQGVALLVNPKRGKSLQNFISRIEQFFNAMQNYEYKLYLNLITFDDQKYIQFINFKKLNQNFNPNTDDYVFIEIKKSKMNQKQNYNQKQMYTHLGNKNQN